VLDGFLRSISIISSIASRDCLFKRSVKIYLQTSSDISSYAKTSTTCPAKFNQDDLIVRRRIFFNSYQYFRVVRVGIKESSWDHLPFIINSMCNILSKNKLHAIPSKSSNQLDPSYVKNLFFYCHCKIVVRTL